eukprot:3876964-Prymnesium_polylepis.1
MRAPRANRALSTPPHCHSTAACCCTPPKASRKRRDQCKTDCSSASASLSSPKSLSIPSSDTCTLSDSTLATLLLLNASRASLASGRGNATPRERTPATARSHALRVATL